MPTQEIDAHSATHLLHTEWCEFCLAGRGRNKPHRRNKGTSKEATESEPGRQVDVSVAEGIPGIPSVEDSLPFGLIPRVCMDYF